MGRRVTWQASSHMIPLCEEVVGKTLCHYHSFLVHHNYLLGDSLFWEEVLHRPLNDLRYFPLQVLGHS